MTDNDRQEALRQSKLAAELSEEQCRVLSNLIALRDLKDGEILVSEGQSDNHLYAIVKGALCVVKNAGTADEVTLVTMSAGDFAEGACPLAVYVLLPRTDPQPPIA